MYPVTLSIGDIFKRPNNRPVTRAYVCPAFNGLLEKLINFTEKARNVKGAFLRQVGAPKLGICGYFSYFFKCFIITNILLYIRTKKYFKM